MGMLTVQFIQPIQKSRRLRPLLRNPDQRPQNLRRALEPLLRRLPVVEEHDLHVRPHARADPVLGDVGDQAFGIGENVVAERQHRAFRADLDASRHWRGGTAI